MGTRNLTMVVLNNEIKVAQYGQWDGYPSGLGCVIAEFISQKMDLKKFKKAISECKQVDKEKLNKMWKDAGANDTGMIAYDKAEEFGKKYPEFSRNTSGEILSLIQDGGVREVDLDLNFAADSLFCEWAYLLDLDNKVLEIYKGFNKEELSSNDRFFDLKTTREDYKQIKLIHTFRFNEITPKKTMKDLEKRLEQENQDE